MDRAGSNPKTRDPTRSEESQNKERILQRRGGKTGTQRQPQPDWVDAADNRRPPLPGTRSEDGAAAHTPIGRVQRGRSDGIRPAGRCGRPADTPPGAPRETRALEPGRPPWRTTSREQRRATRRNAREWVTGAAGKDRDGGNQKKQKYGAIIEANLVAMTQVAVSLKPRAGGLRQETGATQELKKPKENTNHQRNRAEAKQ